MHIAILGMEMVLGVWRLKLHNPDGVREDDRRFDDLTTALAAARAIRAKRPDLRLVVTVPSDASEEDRNRVRQIGTYIPPDSK
jgi:Na+-translocating ferredoxin:NAD+ oxidoreductase RnfC subunit